MRCGLSVLLAAALFALDTASAETITPGAYPACLQTATAQSELNACAGAAAKMADDRLNTSYQAVLKYLDPDDKALLVAAQRAWVAFRDSDCAFWGARGSVGPMNAAFCRASLSDERAAELESWPPNAPRDALAPSDAPRR